MAEGRTARRMPAERPAKAASARELALSVLDATLLDREPPEARFARETAAAGLSARDRAFARILYTTVLRRKAAIDRALALHLREPPRQRSAMNLLRLGAAQLLYLRTAPHAGVGESVELAKRRRLAPPGLVNAVLRKLVGQDPPALPPWRRSRHGSPDAGAPPMAPPSPAPSPRPWARCRHST
jgi:16S rRNA (cytosine967-C5)-methyltransferase